MLKGQLQKRLQSLRGEFESGQKVLADLEAKQTNVRETLLRISGAIQVLEEMLAAQGDADVVEPTSAPITTEAIPAESETP
jgi:hypothetical protein